MATIVIAEDHLPHRKLLSYRLRRVGHDVISSVNGLEALDKVEKSCPQLVILDISMPEMDGLTTLKTLRADERFKNTPVILLTASAVDKHRKMAFSSGADRFLSKPVSTKELIDTVNELIN